MFNSKDLKNLIVPLFLEQLFTILVGLADTFVISFVGEAAVSGVSLVNSFNTIFIFLFTALASGGAVIVSQYIGSGDKRKAGRAASQLLMFSTVVALSSIVALFGTYQIAANGIAQSIWSLAALVCVTMGPVFITVIGQCMGAGEDSQAEYYFHRLLKITLLMSVVWNMVIFALTPVMMPFFDVAPETRRLTVWLVLIHNVFNCIAFPFADPLGKGLRAAGDVKFTMVWSIFTTIGVRLLFSILFAVKLGMGVIGIAAAMCLDWCIRAVIFFIRFRGGKWKQYQLI